MGRKRRLFLRWMPYQSEHVKNSISTPIWHKPPKSIENMLLLDGNGTRWFVRLYNLRLKLPVTSKSNALLHMFPNTFDLLRKMSNFPEFEKKTLNNHMNACQLDWKMQICLSSSTYCIFYSTYHHVFSAIIRNPVSSGRIVFLIDSFR